MRTFSAILLVAVVGGCTSVRVMQRDGCWVRRTSGWMGHQVHDEMGFCARPPPRWSEDRVTRVAQECVVLADYKWQSRALAAWNRGEPLPPQDPDQKVLQECMTQASRILAEENAALRARYGEENAMLKSRLGEATEERNALRASSDQDRARLQATLEKVTEQLGEAAKKPSPPAYATATASSEGRTEATAPGSATAPVTVVTPAVPGAPAPTPAAVPVAPVFASPPAAACAPEPTAPRRQARSGKQAEPRTTRCPTPPPVVELQPTASAATLGDASPGRADEPLPSRPPGEEPAPGP